MTLRAVLLSVTLALPSVALAQTPEAVCETTAKIVGEAQALRVEGKTSDEAIADLTAVYADRSEAFRDTAIPMLVSGFVYTLPDTALGDDLAALWKENCLTTDLSSALPAE